MAEELLRSEMLVSLFGVGAFGILVGSLGAWGVITEIGKSNPSRLRDQLRVAENKLIALTSHPVELPPEARGAFEAWVSYEHQTREALERWKKRCDEVERSVELARSSALEERRHPVFLDGLSASGKTTFAWRLLMPSLSSEELQGIKATPDANRTPAVPIVLEDRKEGGRILHELYFYDTAGERGATLLNCLDRYHTDRGASKQKGVILFVWDCSKPFEVNRDFLKGRVSNLYGSKLAISTVASIVVLFNKVDVLAPELVGSKREREIVAMLEVFRKEITSDVMNSIAAYLDSPVEYTAGSMLTGAGFQRCYGLILDRFQLPMLKNPNFDPLDGPPNQPPPEPVATKSFARARSRH
jgi:hypothetical protein